MGKIFQAVAPNKGAKLSNGICASSYAPIPYNLFSPQSYSLSFRIPVPGLKNTFSRSVEGIWQGLKIVNGSINPIHFSRKPKRVKNGIEGHLLGERVLDIVDARREIYRPSYSYYFDNYIPKQLKDDILQKGLDGGVCFFDTNSNLDINDPTKPLSHSVFLVDYFNEYLSKRMNEVRLILKTLYESNAQTNETLAEPVSRAKNFFVHSKPLVKQLIVRNLVDKSNMGFYEARYFDRLKLEVGAS